VVCGFNILHYGLVVWKTAVSVRFPFSALSVNDAMNGFFCFSSLQRWLNACVTLLMLIRSLNYTFNRDTRYSHDDEINCNCVWQCFINIYCLSNRPKKNKFFRASVLFKCYDFNSRVWAFPLELWRVGLFRFRRVSGFYTTKVGRVTGGFRVNPPNHFFRAGGWSEYFYEY